MPAPAKSHKACHPLLIAQYRHDYASLRYKRATKLASPDPGPAPPKTDDFSHDLGLALPFHSPVIKLPVCSA